MSRSWRSLGPEVRSAWCTDAVTKPLVFQHGAAGPIFFTAAGVWLIFEFALSVRQRARVGWRASRDPTSIVLFAGIGGAIFASVRLGRDGVAQWPGGRVWPYAAGLTLLVAGVALRAWSIATLGRFFQYRIAVQPDHSVVTSGPYRYVRHPSYSGLALALLGYALVTGSVLSVVAMASLGGSAIAVRIHAEERQLHDALGPEYDAFAAQRKRLLPGVW